MKKIVLINIGVLLCTAFYANNINTLQDSALNNYINKDYEKALYFYDSISKLGYSSADLHFNLANCYYNLGNIAEAIYNYEKANVLAPNDKDISHNLNIARKSVRTKTEQKPEVFYVKWFNSILDLFSSNAWLYISITAFVISLIMTGLYFFSTKLGLRKTGFYLGILLLIFSIICLIFSRLQANKILNNKFAIVFESSVIKSSPSEEGTNLFEISEGMKVEVLDELQEWSEIKLDDGKEGWLLTESIRKL